MIVLDFFMTEMYAALQPSCSSVNTKSRKEQVNRNGQSRNNVLAITVVWWTGHDARRCHVYSDQTPRN